MRPFAVLVAVLLVLSACATEAERKMKREADYAEWIFSR